MTTQQRHNHFGSYASAATLPDDTAEPTLQAGDLAYATAEKRTYTCTVPGSGTWVPSSPFEIDTIDGEIQPITGETTRGFVVGSQDMNDSGAANDARMFFDKGGVAGSFRAGEANGTEWDAVNRGAQSAAFGLNTQASGDQSFACGNGAVASGNYSEASGYNTQASGAYSHAEGFSTQATASASHAEGYGSVTTGSTYSAHAEGYYTTASGEYSHSEGNSTTASGSASHAEGTGATASGYASHAEGDTTESSGNASHAEGRESIARLNYSRATAGHSFVGFGDGQNIEVNCGTTTLDATPKELSLAYDLTASDIAMQTASVWGFTVRVVGKSSEADGNAIFAILEGLMRYDGSNVTLVGVSSPLAPRFRVNTTGAAAWNVEIQNHTGPDDFVIMVTGAAALTVRWVAQIQATEIIVA